MKKLIFIVCVLVFLPLVSLGADIKLRVNTINPTIGDPIKFVVYFNSDQGPVSTISGGVIINPDLFSTVKILEENSVVGVWIEKPKLNGKQVGFSAFLPGGAGEGALFTLELTPKTSGLINLELLPALAYLNDGQGTEIKIAGNSFQLLVLEEQKNTTTTAEGYIDKNPPQMFEIRVARDEKIFNNQWFVVFNTIDQESGINYYEILETSENNPNGIWQRVESPYVLKDQTRKSFVFVKAYDNNGNFSQTFLEPQKQGGNLLDLRYIYVIIFIILFSGVIWLKKKQNAKKV